jgi:hypothetical protein
MSTPGRPELRISDEEREAAVAALSEHYAAGRLTKDEYDERSAVAFGARTASALRPLFVDLPGPHPFAAAPRGGPPRFGAPAPARPSVAAGRRSGFRVPFVPLLLVLIGLSVLFEAPWLIFIGLGVWWFARSRRRDAGWSGCGSSGRMHGGR